MSARLAAAGLSTTLLLLATGACTRGASTPTASTASTATKPTPSLAAITPDALAPETCRPCHGAIVEAWSRSQHARSSSAADPIYAAMGRLRATREGPAVLESCARCHGPARPGATPSEQARAAQVGVGCDACHGVVDVDATGHATHAPAGAFAGPHTRGPRGDATATATTTAPHGLVASSSAARDGATICLSCHGELANAAGVAACSTGVEWQRGADPRASCVDCHMPWIDAPSGTASTRARHRAHTFAGPHFALRARAANPSGAVEPPGAAPAPVTLAGALTPRVGRRDALTLRATLTNVSGHAFPTGFPGRVVVLSLVGFDADDREVWRNVREDPMTEHPDAVLNRTFVDDEGAPTIAPYAARVARDTRLTPGEARTIEIEVPATVAYVQLKLVMRLVAAPLAARLGLEGPGVAPLLAPRPVAAAVARRAAPTPARAPR